MNKKTFLEVCINFNDCLTPFFILQLSAKVAYFLYPFTDTTANCRSKQDTSSHDKFTNGRCVNSSCEAGGVVEDFCLFEGNLKELFHSWE